MCLETMFCHLEADAVAERRTVSEPTRQFGHDRCNRRIHRFQYYRDDDSVFVSPRSNQNRCGSYWSLIGVVYIVIS